MYEHCIILNLYSSFENIFLYHILEAKCAIRNLNRFQVRMRFIFAMKNAGVKLKRSEISAVEEGGAEGGAPFL